MQKALMKLKVGKKLENNDEFLSAPLGVVKDSFLNSITGIGSEKLFFNRFIAILLVNWTRGMMGMVIK